MSRNIRAIAQLKKNSELYNLFIVLGVAILDVILYCIFLATGVADGESARDYLEIMFGITVGVFCSISIFIKVFMMVDEVSRGLCFGMTRRTIFIYSRVVDLLEILIVAVIALVVLKDTDASLIFKIAITFYGIIVWIEGLAGNNVIRYGKIAYWVFYVAFMLIAIGGPRGIKFIPGGKDFMAIVVDMFINPFYNQGIVWAWILGFTALGMIVNWLTFRKISVNTNL